MAVLHKAIGVAWGVTSSGYTYTGSATTLTVNPDGQTLRKTAQLAEHLDGNGETVGLTYFNATSEITLRVYPKGSTLAAAVTNNVLPAVGDKFVITDAGDTDIAGTFIVQECGKERRVGEKVMFDITVKKWPTDLSADTAAS